MENLAHTLDVSAVPPPVLAAAVAVILLVLAVIVVLLRRRSRRVAPASAARRVRAAQPAPARSPYERLRQGLAKTREGLLGSVTTVLAGRALDAAAVEDLETALIRADVGVRTTERLLAGIRKRSVDAPVRDRLADEMRSILDVRDGADTAPPSSPHVIMVVGVNGVGKTTSIGKLAARHANACARVLLVAGDTFRAAAIEQLGVWGERAGVELIRQQQGSDPAAVVFDGMRAALARKSDVVIVDTAGRLHTKTNLMEELRKVRRVIAREIPGAPHETLLVLDATTGQNGLAQARAFVETLNVTGIVLTKLDGTAKGGIVIAVAAELGIPIRYVGVGEAIDDLRDFDAAQFVEALLGDGATAETPRA